MQTFKRHFTSMPHRAMGEPEGDLREAMEAAEAFCGRYLFNDLHHIARVHLSFPGTGR